MEERNIVLSASGRFFDLVCDLENKLLIEGVSVYTPNMENFGRDASLTMHKKNLLTLDFLKKIEHSEALLVVSDHSGYVGVSVSMEVGFAFAKGIRTLKLHRLNEAAIDSLCKDVTLDEIIRLFRF